MERVARETALAVIEVCIRVRDAFEAEYEYSAVFRAVVFTLALIVMLVLFGIVGEMDYHDRMAALSGGAY